MWTLPVRVTSFLLHEGFRAQNVHVSPKHSIVLAGYKMGQGQGQVDR